MNHNVYCALGILILVVILSAWVSSVCYKTHTQPVLNKFHSELLEGMENQSSSDDTGSDDSQSSQPSQPSAMPSSQETEGKCEFIAKKVMKTIMDQQWMQEKAEGCDKSIMDYLDSNTKQEVCKCPACQTTPSTEQAPGTTQTTCTTACALPAGINEGDVVQCQGDPSIYRVSNCQKHLYPDTHTYQTYGSPTAIQVSCNDIEQIKTGDNVPACSLPPNVQDGEVINCPGNAGIYKVDGCTKRWYPNMDVYRSYGEPPTTSISCDTMNKMPNGAQMPMCKLPGGIQNGQAIQCPGDPDIWQVENCQKRYYSWNSYVAHGKPIPVQVDCGVANSIPNGPAMPENQ